MASALDLLRDAEREFCKAVKEIAEDKYWCEPSVSGGSGSLIIIHGKKAGSSGGLVTNHQVHERILGMMPDIERIIGELKRIDRPDWRPLEYRRPKKKGDE